MIQNDLFQSSKFQICASEAGADLTFPEPESAPRCASQNHPHATAQKKTTTPYAATYNYSNFFFSLQINSSKNITLFVNMF